MHLTKGSCLVCEGAKVLTDKTGKKARKIIISLFFEDNLNIQELKKESCNVNVCPICYYQLELLRSTASCFKEKPQRSTCSLCSKCTDLVSLESSEYFETVAKDYKLNKENILCSACLFYLHFRYTVKKNLLIKFPSLKLDESPRKENVSPTPRKENVSPSPRKENVLPSPRMEKVLPSPRKENGSPSARKENVSPSARKENVSPNSHKGKLDLRAIKKMRPLSENKFIKKLLNITDFKLSHQIPFVILDMVDVTRKIINRPRIKIKFKKTKTNPLFKSRRKTENWNSTCVDDSTNISSDEQPEEGLKRKFDEIEDEDSGQTLLKKGVLKGQSVTNDNCDAPKKKKRVSFKEETVEIIDDYTYNSSSEEPTSKPLKNGEKPLENRRLSYELIVNLVNMKVSHQNNSVTKIQHSTSDISPREQQSSGKTNVVNDKSSLLLDSDEDTVKLNSDSDVDKGAAIDDDDAPLKPNSASKIEAVKIIVRDMVEPMDTAENSEDTACNKEAAVDETDKGINRPNEVQISNDKSDDNNETKKSDKSRRGTRKQASTTGKGEDKDELSLSQSDKDQSFNDKSDDNIDSKNSRKSRCNTRKQASVTSKAEENESDENELNLSQSDKDQSFNDKSDDNIESKKSQKARHSARKQASVTGKAEENESEENELSLEQLDKDRGSNDNNSVDSNESKNSRKSRRSAKKQASITDKGEGNESDENELSLDQSDKDQGSNDKSVDSNESKNSRMSRRSAKKQAAITDKGEGHESDENELSLDQSDKDQGSNDKSVDKNETKNNQKSRRNSRKQTSVPDRGDNESDEEKPNLDKDQDSNGKSAGDDDSHSDIGKSDANNCSEKNETFRQRVKRRASVTCDREEDEADGKEDSPSDNCKLDGNGDSETSQSVRQNVERRASITCDSEEVDAGVNEGPDSEKLRNSDENEDTQETTDIPGGSSKVADETTESKVTCVESDSKTKTDENSSKDVENDEKRESEARLEEEQDADPVGINDESNSGTTAQEDSFKGFDLRLETDTETHTEKCDAEEEACKRDEHAGKSSDIIDLEDKGEATEIAAEMAEDTEAKSKSTEGTDGLTEPEFELALINKYMASEEKEGETEKENDRLNRLNSLEKEDLFSIIGLNDTEADNLIENNKVQKSLPENESNVEQTSETVDANKGVNEDGSKNEDKQNTHTESERKEEGDATDDSEDILRISDLNAIIE